MNPDPCSHTPSSHTPFGFASFPYARSSQRTFQTARYQLSCLLRLVCPLRLQLPVFLVFMTPTFVTYFVQCPTSYSKFSLPSQNSIL